jgi:hypothetical protein
VSFCHQLLSAVCVLHFSIFIKNCWANMNQIWQELKILIW